MASDKTILESKLGQLLGFDDGASDVLEHLLTIESLDDLVEYLTQLLGDPTPEIIAFVDNVGKFKNGEPLPVSADADSLPEGGGESKTKLQTISTAPSKNSAGLSSNQQPSSKQQALQSHRNTQPNKSRVPPPRNVVKGVSSTKASNTTNAAAKAKKEKVTALKSSESQKPEDGDRVVEKRRPTKGKAEIVCGCFGNLHKPLTNCLYCGRISCIEEGYDFCPFCGYLVEDVVAGQHVDPNDVSWLQKERLLRFDREFARRTEIFDDQADYQAPSTWMNPEERARAEETEEKQLQALKRPKQVLNLGL